MHLLIDVRTSSSSDIPNLYYGEIWADIWQKHHPHDRITFLAHTEDPVDEKYECIFIKKGWRTLFGKKLAHHEYGPDRVVSFSRLPLIDPKIPTIVHVHNLTHHLYPDQSWSIFKRKYEEYSYKKLLGSARHIIVPHIAIGKELGEIYGIGETKMSVIPYLTPIDTDSYREQSILPHGISGNYYITEGTPGEEWNPLGIINTYADYIKTKGGIGNLIILGDVGENLHSIKTLVRARDITSHVKILGILSREETHCLYAHAQGWIYGGYHYSRGATVNIASGYGVPLFLSNIVGLQDYSGTFFHPNHIDTLSTILSMGSRVIPQIKKPNNTLIIEVYTRIIAE